MAFPGTIAVGKKVRPALDETVYADGDLLVAVWRDDGGGTSNLYQSVDSESDADFVHLRSANVIPETVICPTETTRTLRFFIADPSGVPSPNQSVEIKVKCRYVDLFGATGEAAEFDLRLREDTTSIAVSADQSLSTGLTEFSLFLTVGQINSVGDWADLNVSMEFRACAGDSVPNAGDLDLECSRCRIIFSP